MLSLHSVSPERWLHQVQENLSEILIDHAHCEKKAAGTAMNLLFSYVEHNAVTKAMTEIVNEELEHFHMVIAILQQRKIRFRKLAPAGYGSQLHALARKEEPGRTVDRLLVAGLIEARSCERFSLLREHAPDAQLRDFYGSLFESEARHYATYVRLAKDFATEATVKSRLEYLAAEEAKIIAVGDSKPRMHS
jgi:tRNA 2-(methylsulfanyl)-N6-isopentenyladenosine37 hydroxylase